MKLLYNLLIWLDQGFNCIVKLEDGWGSPDETLCARVYRLREFHPSLLKWLDRVFFWEPNHCRVSYEYELNRHHLPKEYQNEL